MIRAHVVSPYYEKGSRGAAEKQVFVSAARYHPVGLLPTRPLKPKTYVVRAEPDQSKPVGPPGVTTKVDKHFQQYRSNYNYPPPHYGGVPPSYPPPPPNQPPESDKDKYISGYAKSIIASAFVIGLGVGVYFDSEVTVTPTHISSTELIDRYAPSADICMAYGYSATVFDIRAFVSYNPFNVYIAQPVVKSGCVMRRANTGVLEQEALVTKREVDLCKQRMNTFAFVGDLQNAPEVNCVYHSEEAENEFLTTIKRPNLFDFGKPTE